MSSSSTFNNVPELAKGGATQPLCSPLASQKRYWTTSSTGGSVRDSTNQQDDDACSSIHTPTPTTRSRHYYTATIAYYVESESEPKVFVRHEAPDVTHCFLAQSLCHYYKLRKHLNSALSLHGHEPSLSAAGSFSTYNLPTHTPLEMACNTFAYHHIGIYESLKSIFEHGIITGFGISQPSREFRQSRNYFAHGYCAGKLGDRGTTASEEFEPFREEEYRELLRHVEANVDILAQQLDDDDLWTPWVQQTINVAASSPVLDDSQTDNPFEPNQEQEPRSPTYASTSSEDRSFYESGNVDEVDYSYPRWTYVNTALGFCLRSKILRNVVRKIELYFSIMLRRAEGREQHLAWMARCDEFGLRRAEEGTVEWTGDDNA